MASMARYGMEVCEVQEQPRASATTSDTVDEPLPEAPAAAPSIEVPTPEVLITEQGVVFSTTATVAPQRQWAGHRLLASIWRVLAGRRTHHTGVCIPRRTISSAPGCPVKSTAYELDHDGRLRSTLCRDRDVQTNRLLGDRCRSDIAPVRRCHNDVYVPPATACS